MKIRAKKSLWQNFLQDEEICKMIASSIAVDRENIIEVWPGYGALTKLILLQNPKALHLVELDKDMIFLLQKAIGNGELQTKDVDFQIHHQDILQFSPTFSDYSVIANIPYYITSPILGHFLYDINNKPKQMVIMMQKEVWEKILWGKKEKSSVLSLMIEKKCSVKKVTLVPKTAFFPAPKVDSIVLAFTLHTMYSEVDDALFLKTIKMCFVEPRKTLQNNLLRSWCTLEEIHEIFSRFWFTQSIRAEDISLDVFIKMSQNLRK